MLGVSTEDAWAAELLRHTYPRLRCASAQAKAYEFIPARAGFAQSFCAVRDLFAAFASEQESCLAFYGAAVAFCNGAALILGESGVGKTVLALNLTQRGARFLADETALLELDSGKVFALPRRPSLRETGLRYLLDESLAARVARSRRAYCAPRGRVWYALGPSQLGFEPDARAYALKAVFILTERGPDASLETLPFSELLPAVVRRIHGARVDFARLARLYAILRTVRAYRVCVGSPAETADLVSRGVQCA